MAPRGLVARMAEVMEAAPDPMVLQQGAAQVRRKRANTVITTGMHGSHRTAQPRPPPVAVNSEPTETRARGRTHAIGRMEQASAERDAAYQRELLEAETAGQPRPPQKLSELQSAFGDIDKVCVGLLREGKVPEALQYLETLRGMVDTIVTQLEPKVAHTDRLTLPAIAGLTPRGATGKHSRRPLSERGSNATRMRSGDAQPQPPQPPKDGPRKGDDRLMDLKNAEAKKLREQLAEKDEKIAEQAKRLEEVDERIATMKEKHKRVESNSKFLVKNAESNVVSLTQQVSQLTVENKMLQTRYQETAAVVGLDYKQKSNVMSRVNENQEWEGKVRGSRRVLASVQAGLAECCGVCVAYLCLCRGIADSRASSGGANHRSPAGEARGREEEGQVPQAEGRTLRSKGGGLQRRRRAHAGAARQVEGCGRKPGPDREEALAAGGAAEEDERAARHPAQSSISPSLVSHPTHPRATPHHYTHAP